MVDKVTVPTARASILWLIGEYSDRISKLAPDVLRKMAKSFPDEVRFCRLSSQLHEFLSLGNNS
jgi:AP-3 complex subunit beta